MSRIIKILAFCFIATQANNAFAAATPVVAKSCKVNVTGLQPVLLGYQFASALTDPPPLPQNASAKAIAASAKQTKNADGLLESVLEDELPAAIEKVLPNYLKQAFTKHLAGSLTEALGDSITCTISGANGCDKLTRSIACSMMGSGSCGADTYNSQLLQEEVTRTLTNKKSKLSSDLAANLTSNKKTITALSDGLQVNIINELYGNFCKRFLKQAECQPPPAYTSSTTNGKFPYIIAANPVLPANSVIPAPVPICVWQ